MQNEGECALRRFFLKDARNVSVSFTGMDHERKAGFACSRDMDAKALLLIRTRAIVVMIIYAGLADPRHFLMARELHEVRYRDVRFLCSIVGMGSNRAEHLVVSFGYGEDIVEAADPPRDCDHETNACHGGAREHGIELALKLWKIEMAVTVDQHHGKMKDLYCSSCESNEARLVEPLCAAYGLTRQQEQ